MRAMAFTACVMAAIATSAHGQRTSRPWTLPDVAASLEPFGVEPPPFEFAQAHRDYVLALGAANASMPRPLGPAGFGVEAQSSTPEREKAIERAGTDADEAERVLFAAISSLVPDASQAIETARAWTRAQRLAQVGHDQTGVIHSFATPVIPPASSRLSQDARAAILRELGVQVAALEQRLVEFNRLYQREASLSSNYYQQADEAARVRQRELFRATMRVLQAQWDIQREFEARLRPEEALRARDRFIHERMRLFAPQSVDDQGWVDPVVASPAQTLMRLRQSGAITAESEPRVRARLSELMTAERALGTRLIEACVAPLDAWGETETRYDRANSLAAPFKKTLVELRAGAARDLAEITDSPWLLDGALPQPAFDRTSRLSPEDELLVGVWQATSVTSIGSGQIRELLSSPPRLRRDGAAEWCRLLELDQDDEPLIDALLERAEDRWQREVAPLAAKAQAAADPLAESAALRGRRQLAEGNSSDPALTKQIDVAERETKVVAAARTTAWKQATLTIDEFADGLHDLLGDRIGEAQINLIRIAPRAALSAEMCRGSRYVAEADGGLDIDPIDLFVSMPFVVSPKPARAGMTREVPPHRKDDPQLLKAVALAAPALDAACRANQVHLYEWTELHLLRVTMWTLRPDQPGAQAQAVERDRRSEELATQMRSAWRQGVLAFMKVLTDAVPERAHAFQVEQDGAEFPYIAHPLSALQALRREVTEAEVEPEALAPVFALVSADIEASVGHATSLARTPIVVSEDPMAPNATTILMERWNEMLRHVEVAFALSPTAAWLLARTLPEEQVARCPTLVGMKSAKNR